MASHEEFDMVHSAQRRLPLLLLAAACLSQCIPLAAAAPSFPSHPGDGGEPFGIRHAPASLLGSAVQNIDTGMSFASIQAAISAASPGNTLEVQVPDLLEGLVLVDRSLTLRGQTGSEVVRMAVDTGHVGDSRGWFMVAPGVELHVRDLTFDGNGHLVHQAFRHRGDGSFENCHFRDIKFEPSAAYHGTAIVVFDAGDLVVRNCTFEEIGREGMLAFGPGVTNTVFEGNTYIGKGPGDWFDYALEVGAGATVTAVGNTITGCQGIRSSNGFPSAGILATTFYGGGTVIEATGNTFLDNLVGLAVGETVLDTSTGSASFNRFFGNTNAGISSIATTPFLAQNNWWGCNGGPGAAGCDRIVGTGTVEADPWLHLTLSASPGVALQGESSLLSARLTQNSDGTDTSFLGAVADGTEILFDGGGLGAPNPPAVGTLAGVATSDLLAQVEGAGTVTAALDNQVATAPLAILAGVVTIPTLSTLGLLALVAALAFLGLRRLLTA